MNEGGPRSEIPNSALTLESIHTPEEALATLQTFYASLYSGRKAKHDSPEKSRISMMRRMREILRAGIPTPLVLNVGSGPQSLERQLLTHSSPKDRETLNRLHFFTLDFSPIPANRLLAQKPGRVSHVRASGTAMPYHNDSFGLVVSNHAIDFMPREAFSEAFRVLHPGAHAIFYFHHPRLIEGIDLDEIREIEIRRFWKFLREEEYLLKDTTEIHGVLEAAGFGIETIETNADNENVWWEVVCSKPANQKQ